MAVKKRRTNVRRRRATNPRRRRANRKKITINPRRRRRVSHRSPNPHRRRRPSRRRTSNPRRRRVNHRRRNPGLLGSATGLLEGAVTAVVGMGMTNYAYGILGPMLGGIVGGSPLASIGIKLGIAWGLGEAAKKFGFAKHASLLAIGGAVGAGQDVFNMFIGGGGLGDLGIRYGYQRFLPEVMAAVVLVLILFVQAVQSAGDWLVRRMRH